MLIAKLNEVQKQRLYDILTDQNTVKKEKVLLIQNEFDVAERTSYNWLEQLSKYYNVPINSVKSGTGIKNISIVSEEAKKICKLEDENKQLKKALNEAKDSILSSDKINSLFEGLNDFKYIPKSIPNFHKLNSTVNGVPVLMLSDLHYGEVVNPAEVGYVNQYNSNIASRRINYVVDEAISIVKNDWKAYRPEWFVLALIGDIVSGTIHDELAESNDRRIITAVLEVTDILIYQIEKIKHEFGKVYVPCVVGNHGRLHKKFRAKGQVEENYEYMIYKSIERHFNNDKDVVIQVSETPDLRFDIFNKRFLLTHGNTLGGGGGGIAGILPLLYRGNYKKQERATSINNSYDTLLIGHYHQSLFLGKVICNGTTKGVDEYALNLLNIPFEKPSQNLFIVDRAYNEITYRLPVFCEPAEELQINHTIKTY